MQSGFVGDIGDYGKYGLLDTILREAGNSLTIGVNWYHVPGGDTGTQVQYLQKPEEFQPCFPEIYEYLQTIVAGNRRSIKEIEESLPNAQRYVFFSDSLLSGEIPPKMRKSERERWFDRSVERLQGCDIIFLDPDNGIRPQSVKDTHKNACKYVFHEEIQQYFNAGHSVVVYNHRDRKPKDEYDKKFREIARGCNIPATVPVIRFHRRSVRDYIFIGQEKHKELFGRVIESLTKPPAGFLFEKYQ
jgi:hypothetical protein